MSAFHQMRLDKLEKDYKDRLKELTRLERKHAQTEIQLQEIALEIMKKTIEVQDAEFDYEIAKVE